MQTETWRAETFLEYVDKSILKKPRFQRPLRWNTDQMRAYIQFLIRWKHSGQTLLVNEEVLQFSKVYKVADGNNRTHAICQFAKFPLVLFPDMMPDGVPEESQTVLRGMSIVQLLKMGHRDLSKLNLDADVRQNVEIMLDTLREWDFLNVQITLTIAKVPTSDMSEIFTAINTGGTPLSPQEILASESCMVEYDAKELGDYYFAVFRDHVVHHFTSMNQGETLDVILPEEIQKLSLFEVLVAFEIHLSETYGNGTENHNIVNRYNGKKGHDMVFDLYHYLYGQVTHWSDMLGFLQKVESAVKQIKAIYDTLYDANLKSGWKMRYSSIKKRTWMTLIIFLYTTHGDGKCYDSLLRLICAYDELVSDLESEQDRVHYHRWNAIHIGNGSHRDIPFWHHIRTTKTLPTVPTVDIIREVIQRLLDQESQPKPNVKRPKAGGLRVNTGLQKMAFSAFFHRLRIDDATVDHVIPTSITHDPNEVNLDRMGNLTLLPRRLNSLRRNMPITDSWVKKHDLIFERYPTQEEYNTICQDDQLVDADSYHAMCSRRESLYIEKLLQWFE